MSTQAPKGATSPCRKLKTCIRADGHAGRCSWGRLDGGPDGTASESAGATQDARELAKRWADWHTWAGQRRAAGDFDAEYDGPWDPHGEGEGSDRERLETWVRERMATCCLPGEYVKLLEASGLRGDHEILAYGVGLALGGVFQPGTGGWHSRALELCEAAGWPS